MAGKARTDGFDEFVGQVTEEELSNDSSSVVSTQRMFSDEQLRSVNSFDDALAMVQESGEVILTSDEEVGNSFNETLNGKDKDKLVGTPFLAISWRFNESSQYFDADDKPVPFVSITAITQHGQKFIVNDGSTGLAAQLRAVSDRTGKYGPMMFRQGLRASEYDVVIEGRKSKATTYYVG